MTATILEAIKSFKYDGKIVEIGDEFIPVGGKWDHIMTNPEKGFVREVTAGNLDQEKAKKLSTQAKKLAKETNKSSTKAIKKIAGRFPCPDCDRDFETDRGLAVHKSRYCKK